MQDIAVYLVFGAIIGIIVSIDVSGLIVSQYLDYTSGKKSPVGEAWRHASWHAGLFLLYILSIDIVIITLPPFLIKIFEFIVGVLVEAFGLLQIYFPDLGLNPNTLAESVSWLGGLIAAIFVWKTYLEKIVEDHSQKTDDFSRLRKDVWAIFWLLKKSKILKNIASHTLAASVAIDMLAISALIKFSLSERNWFGHQLIDKAVFGIEIFIVVFVISTMVGYWAKRIGVSGGRVIQKDSPRNKNLLKLLVVLRMAEPLLVFYFLMRLIASLIVKGGLFDPDLLSVEPLFLIASFFLTVALVVKQGKDRIKESVEKGLRITSNRAQSLSESLQSNGRAQET